jgi:hypothetical protein
MSDEPLDFLGSEGPSGRFGGRHVPRQVESPDYRGPIIAIAMVVAAALVAGALALILRSTRTPSVQERWTTGPTTYKDALETLGMEEAALAKLKMQYGLVSAAAKMENIQPEPSTPEDYAAQHARGYVPPVNQKAQEYERRAAELEQKIEVQEAKVDRARERKEMLDK